jgi:NitT/TauT family transport system permease protein
LSLKTLEAPLPTEAPAPPRPTAAPRLRAAAAALAPAVLAAAALLIHELLPNRQRLPLGFSGEAAHPYPLLLRVILVASLLGAVAQWAWRPLRPWARHYGPLLAAALFVLAVWDLCTLKTGWLRMPFFPGPDLVLAKMRADRGLLLESAWRSLALLLGGYAVGVAAGLVTGTLIGWWPAARYWGMPFLKVVGPIPATALVALAMTTFRGLAYPAAVALIAFSVWFPMTMLTASGIANVRLSYLDVARTLGAGRRYLIFHVALPAALPSIFVGLFMGLNASFLTLIVAEAVGVDKGLGIYFAWQQGYMDYAKVYAALIIMAAFCSALMTLLFKARDRVLRWQKGVIRW